MMHDPTQGDWIRLSRIEISASASASGTEPSVATGSEDTLDRGQHRLRRLRLDEEEHRQLHGTFGKTLCQRQKQNSISICDVDRPSRSLLAVFWSVTGQPGIRALGKDNLDWY